MTVNQTITAPAVRACQCPLCGTPAGEPCQPRPEGDHLTRYVTAFTAGQITRASIAMVLGDLVVVDGCAVIATQASQPALAEVAAYGWCPASTVLGDDTVYCERDAGHPGSHRAPGADEGSEVVWGDEPAQDDADAAVVVRCAIETGETVVVTDDETGSGATPEERLLLAIYGADPDGAHNVRELRKHAVTCTRDDHTYCLAYLSGIPERAGEDEACPRCRAVDWGQTPDGRDECTRCGWAEPKLVTPQLGRLPARRTPSTLVDRLVEDAHDDSPCPVVGLVVGQVDEDTLEVLWGERRFEEPRRPGTYEPFDALRPARDGAR